MREEDERNKTPVEKLRVKRRDSKARADSSEKNRRDGGAALLVLPSPKEPLNVAKEFLDKYATHDDGLLKLRFWRGDWMEWRGSHWRLSLIHI